LFDARGVELIHSELVAAKSIRPGETLVLSMTVGDVSD
jgi:hypothetical protein